MRINHLLAKAGLIGGSTLSVVLAAGLAAKVASAEPIVWNVGYVNAPGTNYVDLIKTVPDRIAEATDGRLQIELYDTLVPGPEQPAAVRDGRLDADFAIIVWLSAETPYINVSLLPDLIDSVSQFQQMLDPLLREEFAAVWREKYNAKQLAIGAFESQVVISKEPIHTVEDFAGKKVRVSNTGQASMMTALGAVPTPIPFGEIVPALQRGVVDAVMTSVGPANGMGFYTVVEHFSVWGITPVQPWSFIVNQEVWDALPEDLKPIVMQEFRAIEEYDFARWEEYTQGLFNALVAEGMNIYVVPPGEVEKAYAPENIEQAYQDWYALNESAGTDGRALVEKIRELKATME